MANEELELIRNLHKSMDLQQQMIDILHKEIEKLKDEVINLKLCMKGK